MNGTPELPHPIELYFAFEATHDASATDKCFAARRYALRRNHRGGR